MNIELKIKFYPSFFTLKWQRTGFLNKNIHELAQLLPELTSITCDNNFGFFMILEKPQGKR